MPRRIGCSRYSYDATATARDAAHCTPKSAQPCIPVRRSVSVPSAWSFASPRRRSSSAAEGAELVALHLMESPRLNDLITQRNAERLGFNHVYVRMMMKGKEEG